MSLSILGLLLTPITMIPQDPEATSLFGKPLYAAKLSEATRKAYEDNLARAKAEWDADPKSVDRFVWVGRRIAYLGQFREAIKWFRSGFDQGLEGTNVKVKLARHLGHRYISLRLFDEADAIFGKYEDGLTKEKDEIEPDGLPNARNTPIGTVHSNFYYHWALAKFLRGDFKGAAKVHERSLGPESPSLPIFDSPQAGSSTTPPSFLVPRNEGGASESPSPTPPSFLVPRNEGGAPDRFVSTAYWLALIYAKLGQKEKLNSLLAKVDKDLEVIENQSYHRLLLHFKGELSEKELLEKAFAGNDGPTVRYGVGAWRLARGQIGEGVALLEQAASSEAVFAFGAIAAEAELKRIGRRP